MLLALQASVRLLCKVFLWTNTLAYFVEAPAMKKKSFITLAPVELVVCDHHEGAAPAAVKASSGRRVSLSP
jgi:hypothetical protein